MSLSSHLAPGTDQSFPAWHKQVIDAFEEVAVFSTESTPVSEILRLIGRRICELLDLSRCSIYLRREDGTFCGQVGHCADGETKNEGISRLIFGTECDQFTADLLRSASPIVVQDAQDSPSHVRSVMRIWGVRDMLGIPLVVDDEVIGIIYVDNQGAGHRFTDHDIAMAQAFASLTALILHKSWLHGQLASQADGIERQRQLLRVAGSVQSDISRSIVDGGDADDVIDTLAKRLGKPVIRYDEDLKVSGWAAPATWGDRPIPMGNPTQHRTARLRETIAKLDGGAAVAVAPLSPGSTQRAMFVRLAARGTLLGYLEVCEVGRPFGPFDSTILTHAANAVALSLIVNQLDAERKSDRLADVMSKIVQPHTDPRVLVESFEKAGLERTAVRYGLVHFQFAADQAKQMQISLSERREALLSIVASRISAPRAVELIAGTSLDGAEVVLYASARPELSADTVTDAVRAAMSNLQSMTGAQSAIVSDPYPDPIDLPGAIEDLFSLAQVVNRSHNPSGVRRLNELTIVQLLQQRDGLDGATRYAQRLIRPLRSYDSAHKSDLVETLQAYVEAAMNIKIAAEKLNVHENTIRYRLGRIRDISTIDPERFDDLIRVRTAFQVLGLDPRDSSKIMNRAHPTGPLGLATSAVG
ncbi:GAF domain-containing protein [Rhodococcus fascians]|nr:GAF domain-containing protein [Rhodococcus fascians]MBY3998485.1 GAF domain-containing protein [Rhodococcus fascians]MBY4004521.1 GAF domain-containing protein [Rhodococcus fascians]MBY4009298.1 GAF domain-containing protein [Rhodococcus fascians]MBY4019728.1 GAF domain-containing protein [Rhodococcus fascians]